MFKNRLRRLARRLPLYRDILEMRDQLRVLRTMEATRYAEFELERSPRYQDPLRLPRYGRTVNSQNGEDGVIGEVFRRVGTTDRVFVEIGVGDGRENNTAFLLAQGWTGFWVDGDPAFEATIAARPDLSDGCIRGTAAFVTRENVAGVLGGMGVPSAFDFLSLDVDQNTYYVWEGLAAFRPRVIAIEYNSMIPPEVDWKVRYVPDRVWDGTPNSGASLKALERLGARLGYSIVGCDFNGVNAFFVREDLAAGKFLAPFTAENHYEPPRPMITPHMFFGRALLDRDRGPDRAS
jgi:hypothetical protein